MDTTSIGLTDVEKYKELFDQMHQQSMQEKLDDAVAQHRRGKETNQANELVRILAGDVEEDSALRKKLNDTLTRVASQI